MTGDAAHQEPREGPGDGAAWGRDPAVRQDSVLPALTTSIFTGM